MSTIITPAKAIQKPSGKLYLGSDQLNLTGNAWNLIKLNTVGTGFADGIEDTVNHRITPGVAGFYCIVGMVLLHHVVGDQRYNLRLRKNGNTGLSEFLGPSSASEYLSLICSIIAYLTSSDYVDMAVLPAHVWSTVDVFWGERFSYMFVQRVR